jgi:GTP cyclohydrolase I
VGLSKLARIVDVFAKRLQLQERLCFQIAESIQENLNPLGVGLRISAKHYCMLMRGAKKQNSFMETTYFTGVFRNQNVNTNMNTNANMNQNADNNNADNNIEKNVENSYRREFFASLALDNF